MNRKITFQLLLCITVFYNYSFGQTYASYSSADIYLQLKKLNVLGSVLYVAAHPDDENTRLLGFLSKEKLFRTGYLSLTRGDGGQNLIGNEQGVELGLIRTQELLAARRIDGAEQFFSRAYDFGYSKSADETLQFWNKEKILSDVVWIIRKFRPDVIITRFPGDERAGHGHHTTSALLANEAFAAAADPNRFPEQFAEGVEPWQAKRILWNTFNFGGNNTTAEDQLKMDVGTYNPLLGKGYGEIASESRSQHKSQGFGVPRQRGTTYEYFLTTGGEAPKKDLAEGIVTDWNRVEGGKEIQDEINFIVGRFSFEHPEQSVPSLVGLYSKVKGLKDGYWRTKKLQEIQQLVESCSGLFVEAFTSQEYGIQGDSLKLNFVFNNRNGVNAKINTLSLVPSSVLLREQRRNKANAGLFAFDGNAKMPLQDSSIKKSLAKNENVSIPFAFRLADNEPISQPYWLANGIKGGYFDVLDPLLIGRPESIAAYTSSIQVEIEGVSFIFERPLVYKFTDPVKGELYQPLTILPKIILSVSPTVILSNVKPTNNPVVNVNYSSNIDALNVATSLSFQNGTGTDVFVKKLFDYKKGKEGGFTYPLSKIYYDGQKKHIEPVFTINSSGKDELFSLYHKSIRYDHIPAIHYFSPDNIKVINEEVITIGKKVGYIAGAGDRVPDALQMMGYTVSVLNELDITVDNLQKFDAVFTGVRAYNVHDYLATKYNILMDYIKSGGNLIVQYNTNNQLGSMKTGIGPFPFTISRTRVSDETAPVTIALPDHPVFNYPNKITAKDFENWIQERSIYQAEAVDSSYSAPLLMNDPKEKPSSGSLIIGKYGKGNFVYTGLVFFRELPAGVPGAFRLVANLIALPKNK